MEKTDLFTNHTLKTHTIHVFGKWNNKFYFDITKLISVNIKEWDFTYLVSTYKSEHFAMPFRKRCS